MGIEISQNYNLSRLKQWLDYELSASTLLLLSWLWDFTIILAAVAALLFTPFMLKILFEEKKFGWIIAFAVIVVVPLISVFFIDVFYYKFVFAGVILILFYFYCGVLRFAVKDWIH